MDFVDETRMRYFIIRVRYRPREGIREKVDSGEREFGREILGDRDSAVQCTLV